MNKIIDKRYDNENLNGNDNSENSLRIVSFNIEEVRKNPDKFYDYLKSQGFKTFVRKD